MPDCFYQQRKKLPAITDSVDKAADGAITQLIKIGGIGKELVGHVLLHNPKGIAAKRLMVVYSDKASLNDRSFMALAHATALCCLKTAVGSYSVGLEGLSVDDRCIQWQARILTEAFIKAT